MAKPDTGWDIAKDIFHLLTAIIVAFAALCLLVHAFVSLDGWDFWIALGASAGLISLAESALERTIKDG